MSDESVISSSSLVTSICVVPMISLTSSIGSSTFSSADSSNSGTSVGTARPSRTAVPATVLTQPDNSMATATATRGRTSPDSHFFGLSLAASVDNAATKASCGTSTRPMVFIRFLPSFCFSSSLRLRVMSPP